VKVATLPPLAETPNPPEKGKYKPVVVSPAKFSDGAKADPFPNVRLSNELTAADVAL
jgi:hypothetical protein